tara:strand:+ start:653 stop:1180 length:528 start_codon:yes stop_codon:yes gene_type:complete
MGFEGTPEERYLAGLGFCRFPDTCCGDDHVWFYALCAQPCIQGLIFQASVEGSVEKNEAGCLKPCYVEKYYPCVCTQSCAFFCCYDAGRSKLRESLPDGAKIVVDIVDTGIRTSYKQNLIRKAGGEQDCWVTFLQNLCCLCFCVPCNDAAYVIAKKEKNQFFDSVVPSRLGSLVF